MARNFFWVQGLRRPPMPPTYRVMQQFAIHEIGKAVVATVLRQAREQQGLKPRLERVERVSIVPRGRCELLFHALLLPLRMHRMF